MCKRNKKVSEIWDQTVKILESPLLIPCIQMSHGLSQIRVDFMVTDMSDMGTQDWDVYTWYTSWIHCLNKVSAHFCEPEMV